MTRPTTIDDLDAFRRMWTDDELSLDEMAERFGCCAATVSKIARRLGLPRRKTGRKPRAAAEFAASLPLTGGRWVPGRHGVLRWVPDTGTA